MNKGECDRTILNISEEIPALQMRRTLSGGKQEWKHSQCKLAMQLYGLILTALLLLAGMPCTVYANGQKVADQADLLTEEEENQLQERLAEISNRYQCDVVAATTNSFDGKDRQTYTDDYYYESGYGYGKNLDGIILMVNLNAREFHYATRGSAIRIFTDRRLEQIDDVVTPYLSSGEYAKAFLKYADMAEKYLKLAAEGESEDGLSEGTQLLIAVIIGAVVTGIVLLILFGQMRTVRPKGYAKEYVRARSFRVTGARDLYLYRTVSKHRIEKNDGGGGSTTHASAGGGRSGGRGGSF